MEGRWREKREDADKAAVNRRRDVSAPLPSLFRDSRDFPTTNDKFIPEAMDELASFPLVKRYYRVSFAGESEEGSRKLFDRRPLIRLKRAIRNQAAVFLFARPTIKRLPSIEKRGIFAMEIESRMWSKISRLLFYYLPFQFYYAWIYRAIKKNTNNFVWYNNHLREINFLNNGSK